MRLLMYSDIDWPYNVASSQIPYFGTLTWRDSQYLDTAAPCLNVLPMDIFRHVKLVSVARKYHSTRITDTRVSGTYWREIRGVDNVWPEQFAREIKLFGTKKPQRPRGDSRYVPPNSGDERVSQIT